MQQRHRPLCTGLFLDTAAVPLLLDADAIPLYMPLYRGAPWHTAEVCISACLGWLVAIHLPSPSKYSSVKQQCLIPLV